MPVISRSYVIGRVSNRDMLKLCNPYSVTLFFLSSCYFSKSLWCLPRLSCETVCSSECARKAWEISTVGTNAYVENHDLPVLRRTGILPSVFGQINLRNYENGRIRSTAVLFLNFLAASNLPKLHLFTYPPNTPTKTSCETKIVRVVLNKSKNQTF